MSPPFIHLRLHTDYSLVDGLVHIDSLIESLKAVNIPAIAVTEESNIYSLIKFYKGCLYNGIKAIAGADLWLLDNDDRKKIRLNRITLLVMNNTGYQNLKKLISLSFSKGQYYGKATVKRDWVLSLAEGLIMLSGAQEGDIGVALLNSNNSKAHCLAVEWMQSFPERFYLEVRRTQSLYEEEYISCVTELADRLNLPLVATNDVRFLKKEEFEAHEARVCISEGSLLEDPKRIKKFTDQQYLKTPKEMSEIFKDLPEALQNTVEIAKRCNVRIPLGKTFLPTFPVPKSMNIDKYFCQVSFQGLEKRLKSKEQELNITKRENYIDRLNVEIKVILDMGFAGYFLIVMDFIQWAKKNGISVGPGRGSGAGSLVAYAQEITDIDPIEYDLLFERFLNPERISMPDFDIDFCMDGRDRVIEYVGKRYGPEAVSQIVTFGSMTARAVIRDVARVQGKSYLLADRLSKMIPFDIGITLNKAIEQDKNIQYFLQKDDDANEIWEMACKLEGTVRNIGKHAGGVVISPTTITDFVPICCDEDGSNIVTQFDKDDIEAVGLVKFDFLGLRTLTVIKNTVDYINQSLIEKKKDYIDISLISLNDTQTYNLLQEANTTAIFQLESRGMKELIKKLKPDCLEDLIALVALFRPGPLQSGMVDDFIRRKHGKSALAYPHKDYQYEGLKDTLSSTYGIILYQEQVMKISQVMAGYTLGKADILRRAMGKKKPEEMAKQRDNFIKGCSKSHGIDIVLSGNIFDLVEKFAGYGFNKSHSAAYGLISYQTAWLKTHYPSPFMAAVLSSDMQNTDRIILMIKEVRRMKLRLHAPDINTSEYNFTMNKKGEIYYGLGAIKGLGEESSKIISKLSKEKNFTSIFDLCQRVNLKKFNKKTFESLVFSGSMDSLVDIQQSKSTKTFAEKRNLLLNNLDKAIRVAHQTNHGIMSRHDDLFDQLLEKSKFINEEPSSTIALKNFSISDLLKYEKNTLGMYWSGHPIEEYSEDLSFLVYSRISDLSFSYKSQVIFGIITSIKVTQNKKGSKIAYVILEDGSEKIEACLFQETFQLAEPLLNKDSLVFAEGFVTKSDFSKELRFRVSKIKTIDTVRADLVDTLSIRLDSRDFKKESLQKLKNCLVKNKGKIPVTLEYSGKKALGTLKLNEKWNIYPKTDLIQILRSLFGKDNIILKYRSTGKIAYNI